MAQEILYVEGYSRLVEGETKVFSYVRHPAVDPGSEMRVKVEPALDIAFKAGSIVDDKSMVGTLAEIYRYLVEDVVPPLAPFL